MKQDKVYSVRELNSAVARAIKSEFSGSVWVSGEIQGLRASRDRRHVYFDLVQKHSRQDRIEAKVSAVLFESRKSVIARRIRDSGGAFELKNDIEVKFLCEVDLYVPSGLYSIKIIDIEPEYTLGKVAQNRQKIIEELKKGGMLDRNKTLLIPDLPLKVGLITSASSAAYHDFMNELSISGYGFKVLFSNTHMQGERVEAEVLEALSYFNSLSADQMDLVVITRGGGSKADLSWFDNKNIALAIARTRYPVITALGHQIDLSIADMTANISLKTPTKAAQFLVEKAQGCLTTISSLGDRISRLCLEQVAAAREALGSSAFRVDVALAHYFRFHREGLVRKEAGLCAFFQKILSDSRSQTERLQERSAAAINIIFRGAREELQRLQAKVRLLSPDSVLKRGYSITLVNGRAVSSVKDVRRGDSIETVLRRGRIDSVVREVKEVGYGQEDH